MYKERKCYNFWKMLLAALVLSACFMIGSGTVETHAATCTDMRVLDNGMTSGIKEKSGKYYFKLVNWKVLMSSSKNGSYIETPISSEFFSDGTRAYYITSEHDNREDITYSRLYTYIYSSKKEYLIASLPKSTWGWKLSAAQNNNLYLTSRGNGTSEYSFLGFTYRYNTKSNKLKLVKKGCDIIDRYKNYVIARDVCPTDESATELTIYKFQGSALKKVKKLTSTGLNGCFVDGKVYYCDYPYTNNGMHYYSVLYRCKPNGSGLQKLHTIDAGISGYVYTKKITSTYYEYSKNGESYRYTYATKKETPI